MDLLHSDRGARSRLRFVPRHIVAARNTDDAAVLREIRRNRSFIERKEKIRKERNEEKREGVRRVKATKKLDGLEEFLFDTRIKMHIICKV